MTFKSLAASVILLFFVMAVAEAQITSTTSGPWNVGTTWLGGIVPGAADNVLITSNHVIDVTADAASNNLTIESTARLNFTGAGPNTLAVGGNLTMNGNTSITGTSNAHILNIAGAFLVPGGQSAGLGSIRFTVTGTTSIGGYFQFTTTGTGIKTFNNTIDVAAGGTWDNVIGEDLIVNCNLVNSGFWPASTSGTGIHTVTTTGTTYSYSGPKLININELRLTIGASTTINNFGLLALTKVGGNVLNVGSGRRFNNGDGVRGVILYIAGSGTITGTGIIDFSRVNSTVDYNYAGNQSVYGTAYNRLTISTSGTKTLASGTSSVTNTLTTSGTAVFDVATNALTGAANLIMTGTSGISFARNSVTLPELTGTANDFAAGTTVTFNGTGTQTPKGSSATNPSTTNTYPYQNVNISGASGSPNVVSTAMTLIRGNLNFSNIGRMTLNPVMTVGGTLSYNSSATQSMSNDLTVGSLILSNGVLNYSNRTITVNGTNGFWTYNGGGNFVNNSSNVIFTTGTNQIIGGTTSTGFANLTINNPNDVRLGVDISVNTSLNLLSNHIITGVYSVYVSGGAPVSRTTGFVDGNLKKDVSSPTLTNPTYEIGSGTTYAPATLSLTGISTVGSITVSTIAGDHPGIGSSNIQPSKTANRYWSIKNQDAVFTSFDAIFTFDPSDLDGGANTANFQTKWTANGFLWNTTTAGARTATSTQIVGEPASTLPPSNTSADFQVGELIVLSNIFNRLTGTRIWNDKTTWIEHLTGTVTFDGSANVVGSGGTLFLSELVTGDVIMLQTSAGTVRGTVLSIANDTQLTLTAVAGAASGAYGRQRIPNLATDVVTIGNPLIADATTTIQYDMPSATTINTININTSSSPRTTAQILTHTTTNLLTIQTNAMVNQPGGAATDAWNINAGTASVLGTLTIGSAVNNNARIARVNISTGTLNVGSLVFNTTGNASNEATAVLNLSGAGIVNLSGAVSFTNNLGTLSPGTSSTFNFNGTAGQLLIFPSNAPATWHYNNLLFNNSSVAGVSISPSGQDITPANVTGDVRIQTGTLFTSDDTDITGNPGETFQIDPGATFWMTGSASSFPTVFSTSLGTVAPFGTVKYEQVAPNPISIPAEAFGNLEVLYSGNNYELSPTGTSVAGNLTIGNGTSTPTLRGDGSSNTTAFTVTGDVIINTGAKIDANTSPGRIQSFTVGGNWTNNGTFLPSTTGSDVGVIFDANGPMQPQIISGTATETFYKLTINGTSTDLVQMNKGVTVNNQLTLTNGGLDLNGNQINVTNASTSSITRTSGYIISEKTTAPYSEVKWATGNLTGAFVFPFAKSSTEYIPVTYNITSAGSAASTLTVSTYATPANNTPLPATVTNLNGTSGGNSVVDRFWILTPSTNVVRPTATLTFTALASEKPGSIPTLPGTGITGQSWSASNYWNAPSAGQSFNNNAPAAGFFQVTIPGQLMPNNLSPWALTDAAIILPIKLVSFTAASHNGLVELNWRTETELRNDFFTVQKSESGEEFSDVVEVKGAGTSTVPRSYTAYDHQPVIGKSYYRLKQTDFDKNYSYSKIVSVEVKEALSIYPNPSNGSEINISFLKENLGKDALVKIQDISGKELSQNVIRNLDSKQVRMEMTQQLAPGLYIISIAVGQDVLRQKIVVR